MLSLNIKIQCSVRNIIEFIFEIVRAKFEDTQDLVCILKRKHFHLKTAQNITLNTVQCELRCIILKALW